MAILKRCPDCGEVFVAETANGKYCACCSAKRNIPAAARGKGGGSRKPKPDKLTLDVRQVDAAGLSYGVWRAREEEKKRKAQETLRKSIEERKRKRACAKQQEKEVQDGKSEV